MEDTSMHAAVGLSGPWQALQFSFPRVHVNRLLVTAAENVTRVRTELTMEAANAGFPADPPVPAAIEADEKVEGVSPSTHSAAQLAHGLLQDQFGPERLAAWPLLARLAAKLLFADTILRNIRSVETEVEQMLDSVKCLGPVDPVEAGLRGAAAGYVDQWEVCGQNYLIRWEFYRGERDEDVADVYAADDDGKVIAETPTTIPYASVARIAIELVKLALKQQKLA